MTFVDALIDETKKGNLDSIWKYNEGKKSYSLSITKSPYNGLSFDATLQDLSFIFPNGANLTGVSKDKLGELIQEIRKALIRDMESLVSDYIRTRIL